MQQCRSWLTCVQHRVSCRDELVNFSLDGVAMPHMSGDGEGMQDQTAHMSGEHKLQARCAGRHACMRACGAVDGVPPESRVPAFGACTGHARFRTSHQPFPAPVHADADSDDGEEELEEQEERVALIRQNALMVGQYGKTLLPGAWRGCAKSPL